MALIWWNPTSGSLPVAWDPHTRAGVHISEAHRKSKEGPGRHPEDSDDRMGAISDASGSGRSMVGSGKCRAWRSLGSLGWRHGDDN